MSHRSLNQHPGQPGNTHPERGQGLVEYVLIIALVGLAVVAIIQILEPAVANVFSQFVQEAPVAPPSLLSYTPPPTDTPPPPTPTDFPPGFTPSPTNTPTITPTPTNTPVPTDTPTPTNTPIPTNTPTETPIPPNILFVVGNTGLSAADASIRAQLAALNPSYPGDISKVAVVDDGASQTADATGKDLVFISASVSASDVSNKFQIVAVPVMVMEDGILDDMGMVAGSGSNYHGNQGSQTALAIVGGGHALAANLSNGNYTVYNASNSLVYGLAEAGALKIATLTGNANRSVIFAFTQGAAMPAFPWTAPARRVSFFLYENININSGLTTQGLSLFNASVCWAMTGSACPS